MLGSSLVKKQQSELLPLYFCYLELPIVIVTTIETNTTVLLIHFVRYMFTFCMHSLPECMQLQDHAASTCSCSRATDPRALGLQQIEQLFQRRLPVAAVLRARRVADFQWFLGGLVSSDETRGR